MVGCSRSAGFRFLSTGQGPKPVRLPGNERPYWEIAALKKWAASLKPARAKRQQAPADTAGSAA